jgi:hypothetical protein
MGVDTPEEAKLRAESKLVRMSIPRQTWAGDSGNASTGDSTGSTGPRPCSGSRTATAAAPASPEATGLRIVEALIEALGVLDGRADAVVLFTPADASSSAAASRVMQLVPDFLPHVPLSACAVFRPMDTSGPGCLHAAIGLQYALAYCSNVFVRDMEDCLRLMSQLSRAPPSLHTLCASVAVELVLLPLMQSSLLLAGTAGSRLMDMRCSLWHRRLLCTFIYYYA